MAEGEATSSRFVAGITDSAVRSEPLRAVDETKYQTEI